MTRTESSPRIRLGITVGDPAGIGPEVVARALQAGAHGESRVCVYGDVDAVERISALPPVVERRPFATARVEPGHPDPAAGPGVIDAIRAAANDCLTGALDAMVTAPISKELLARSGFRHPGHTELLEEMDGGGPAVMMLVGGQLRVALATIHCALREVPDRLSVEGIQEVLRVVDRDLGRRFGVPQPRIAVCGLNPHAGEGGRFGDEEERIIRPAVEGARGEGVEALGPLAADSLFTRAVRGEFDAVIGMYHDQALGPLKLHAFGRAVNVTLGLRLVRTSVDHGTAFEIAGRGEADVGSMIEAIRLAREIAQRESAGKPNP